MKHVKLAVMPLTDAKNLQSQMAAQGVELKLNHNEATCRRGCAVTVELLALEKDVAAVQKAYQENFKKLLEGHEVDWELLNQAFDPSAENAVCPACGHQFQTTLAACPDCGLCLGA